MGRFGSHPRVRELAARLGLSTQGDCQERIVEYGLGRVEAVLVDTPVRSLAELRRTLAADLSLDFEFVHGDDDFARITATHGAAFSFPLGPHLQRELSVSEGVLLGKTRRVRGERHFLTVIDARGPRAARSYFTAWHELAHLLVMPPEPGCDEPVGLSSDRDPIESVVDELAARLAFYRPLFRPVLEAELRRDGQLSFATVERVRAACAPESSLLAAAIASVLCAPEPVCLLHAQPAPGCNHALQVDRTTWSESAWDAGLRVLEGFSVPRRSLLHGIHRTCVPQQAVAVEDQSWWEAAGGPLPGMPLRVAAVSRAEFVYGILSPWQS